MPLPIYTLARVPGATDTVEWTDISQRRDPLVYISHEASYEKSRWVSAPRKRPFTVYYKKGHRSISRFGFPWSRHATLAAAEHAARKIAMEEPT